MDRVVPVWPLFIEPRHQQAVGGDHDLRIGGLHGEDHRVETKITGDPGEFQGALHHAERRVAEAVHDPVAERAVVGPDAHRHAALLAELHERGESLPNPLQLGRILGVAVVADVEFLGIGEVPGIDPHLLHPFDSLKRGLRLEVDVGDQGDMATESEQLPADVLQVGRILHRRGRDPDHLATRFDEPQGLRDTGRGVHRVAGDHRLDPDRVRSAESHSPDHHLAGGAAAVGEQVGRIRPGKGNARGGHRVTHGLAGWPPCCGAGAKVIVSDFSDAGAALPGAPPRGRSSRSKKVM